MSTIEGASTIEGRHRSRASTIEGRQRSKGVNDQKASTIEGRQRSKGVNDRRASMNEGRQRNNNIPDMFIRECINYLVQLFLETLLEAALTDTQRMKTVDQRFYILDRIVYKPKILANVRNSVGYKKLISTSVCKLSGKNHLKRL